MVHALPAQIKPASHDLVSQRISLSNAKASWNLWHRRLTHLGHDSMKLLFGGLSTGNSIARINPSMPEQDCAREGCVMGKIARPPSFFKNWLLKVERLTEHKLKTIRSDNGGEYTSNSFERYLTDLGIDHQTTVPYSSQQNGVAENRTIVKRTIALMYSERLPIGLWAEEMDTVVYLKNRSPSRASQAIKSI